jgi:hypothetical protein
METNINFLLLLHPKKDTSTFLLLLRLKKDTSTLLRLLLLLLQ